MKKINIFVVLIVAIASLFTACKKDETTTPTTEGNGTVTLTFDHKVGTENLVLNTNWYKNENNDSFTVSKFQYYISNIQLIKEDGSLVTYPKDESYFLVREDSASTKTVTLSDIPAGNYKGIKYTIGIDATKSIAPAYERTGVLSPTQGMYWAWNSGYIFVRLEGNSPVIPTSGGNIASNPDRKFWFHIGGFGGYSSTTLNNIKTVELITSDITKLGIVKENNTTDIHIAVDVLEMMKTPTTINLAAEHHIMFRDYSINIANNYVDMFKLDHFHN